MENTIPQQAQQAILSLQADVQYYQRRMQESQREISSILGQLGLPSVQMVVAPPDPPALPKEAPLALVGKKADDVRKNPDELRAAPERSGE